MQARNFEPGTINKNPMKTTNLDRRNFFRTTATMTAGLAGLGLLHQPVYANDMPAEESVFMIGPMKGYSPQIGTLVSMLNYNRYTVVNMVKNMTMTELDHLHDPDSNTIGALILHLGATEKFYQVNTFEGRQEYSESEKKIWNAAMSLGDEGRNTIKGHDVKYYLDIITEVREKTLNEFKKKDDKWLLTIDPEWSKERSLNTYWKWFHVCEHEANHRGQIAWLKGRLPGAKSVKE
jgi:uncharacterized damage-inducible protein DinB